METPPVPPAIPPTLPMPSPAPAPALPPAPRRPASSRTWIWVVGVLGVFALGGFALLAVIGSALQGEGASASRGSHGASHLHEVVLEDNDATDKVAVIPVEGVIHGEPIDPDGRTLVELVKQQLQRAAEDDAVKAVILKVDSPGGEVLASDEIYRAIWDFVEANESKPIVVSMGSLAASGGYYVSAPCQWIVANELTMTGSIGVIFHSYNYRALMDKVGVRPTITKSGKLKDMWSGEKSEAEELPEERQIMQAMIDESFVRFKKVIRDGRERAAKLNKGEGRTLGPAWESVADGRILSGTVALQNGLVDELGNFDIAFERARKLAGIESANLVSFDAPVSFAGLFRLFGKSQGGAVRVDLGLGSLPNLPQGRLYFLSPIHAR